MADLDDLLEKTSRTFALSIPRLPEPTRREVTVAYLLFRLADTFEDAANWGADEQLEALREFGDLLESPDADRAGERAAAWAAAVPIEHEGYQELLRETPAVLESYRGLGDEARILVRDHTLRTVRGMAEFVRRTDTRGELQLRDLEDLRHYCYIVAGIVGEMLTELFLLDRPELEPVAERLRARSRAFGEALQLVNILRDASFDATEGRSFLPRRLDREEVFALARRDLGSARQYVAMLQEVGAPRGIVAFTALPVLLAVATLDLVEEKGPGAKVSRTRVATLAAGMEAALRLGRPVVAAG